MIAHLDMDAFFASVEQLDNPELAGKPVIIGGEIRGVVATASYEARVYGIHSAMPMATARRLCPHGIFMRGHGSRYRELSAKIMQRLRKFAPVVQPASIDEAYLDCGGTDAIYGSWEELARNIQAEVAAVTGGLTCSIGIAPVKFIAKICSDINKPNGFFILRPGEVDNFLMPLAIDKLPGVGRHMAARLRSFGITKVGELRELSREFLVARFGKWGLRLHERSHGIDLRTVHENDPAKSESAERTLEKDVLDREILRNVLLEQAERVGNRMRRQGSSGRTITLKLKFSDFTIITRAQTLGHRTNATRAIHEAACALLARETLPMPVRLIGLGVSGFAEKAASLPLPGLGSSEASAERNSRLDQALDSIWAKFGKKSIQRASGLCSRNL
ncbi:MAG: DNA polymerase IV [Desulfovibrio sp.]|nr:DNA polymerase IV [Desulfovibrio sp.]